MPPDGGNGLHHPPTPTGCTSTGGETTPYDFEPYEVATTKEQCKNGGWQNVRRADGSTFTNQGDCIQYVNNGK
jgi:hypothetical protein